MPGMGELIVILLIVLVVFGANKLPGIGDALGRSIKNFKRASNGDDEIEVKRTKKSLNGKSQGQLDAAEADDGEDEDEAEFEEVVVRRKVAKKTSSTAEG
jgi:sec-independent protein translocase protein TatA